MMPERRRVYLAVLAGVLMVAGTAAAMYGVISQRMRAQPTASAEPMVQPSIAGAPAGSARPSAPSIDVAAERLAQRLRDSDGSAEDWALLARSYVQLQRYPEAVGAFARALEKSPGNAAFVAEQSAARKAAGDLAAPR